MNRTAAQVSPALTTCSQLKDKLLRIREDLVKNKFFQQTRTPEQLENEKKALDLLSEKVEDLRTALEICYNMQRFNDAEKANIMTKMDAARRDLLAAARDCGPRIHVAKDVVASVMSFARLKHIPEVITPRNFNMEWQTPVKSAETRPEVDGAIHQEKPVPVHPATSSLPAVSPLAAGASQSQRSAAIEQLQAKSSMPPGSDTVAQPGKLKPAAAFGTAPSMRAVVTPVSAQSSQPLPSTSPAMLLEAQPAHESQPEVHAVVRAEVHEAPVTAAAKPLQESISPQTEQNQDKKHLAVSGTAVLTSPVKRQDSYTHTMDSCMCNLESSGHAGAVCCATVDQSSEDSWAEEVASSADAGRQEDRAHGDADRRQATSRPCAELPAASIEAPARQLPEERELQQGSRGKVHTDSLSLMMASEGISPVAPGTRSTPLPVEHDVLRTPQQLQASKRQSPQLEALRQLPAPSVAIVGQGQRSAAAAPRVKRVAWQVTDTAQVPDNSDTMRNAAKTRYGSGLPKQQQVAAASQRVPRYQHLAASDPGQGLPQSVAAVLPAMNDLGLAGSCTGAIISDTSMATVQYDYDYDEYYQDGSSGMPRRRRGWFGRMAAAVGTVLSVTVVTVGAAFAAAALNAGLDELDHKQAAEQPSHHGHQRSSAGGKGRRRAQEACPDIMLARG